MLHGDPESATLPAEPEILRFECGCQVRPSDSQDHEVISCGTIGVTGPDPIGHCDTRSTGVSIGLIVKLARAMRDGQGIPGPYRILVLAKGAEADPSFADKGDATWDMEP